MTAVVTDAERAAAGRRLVKHRVEVSTLTDLLALHPGFRGARPREPWWWAVAAILAVLAAAAPGGAAGRLSGSTPS